MTDLEERLRDLLHREEASVTVPEGLRTRVIARAVASRPPPLPSGRVVRLRLAGLGAATLALLLVSGSVGLYVGGRIRLPASQEAGRPTPGATSATLAFGAVPAAGLHLAQGLGGGGSGTLQPYFGPARLTWAGQLPQVPVSVPVVRATVDAAAVDNFAMHLGATPQGGGSYTLPGRYHLQVSSADPVAQIPTFTITTRAPPGGGAQIDSGGARAAADAALAHWSLTPQWPVAVTVSQGTPTGSVLPVFTVSYQRMFELGGGARAGLVDGQGDPEGVQVSLDSSGDVIAVKGLVPASERSAAYPLRGGPPVVREALAAPAPAPGPPGQAPDLALTRAQLVYAVALSGGDAYLEPVYLFTGDLTLEGSLEKRVLVPALAGAAIAS